MSSSSLADSPLVAVRDLVVDVESTGYRILDGLSFEARRGHALGILGETGSGKSMTLRAILGLLPRGLTVASGAIDFDGSDMLGLNRRDLARIRGKRIGFVPQQPAQALNPVLTVRSQFLRLSRAKNTVQRASCVRRATDLLRRVGLSDPERVLQSYPGELSGGMAQRVAIAIALFWDPELIVADEPTTALDLTVQKEILTLLSHVAVEEGRALIIVTHDLGVVSHYCDETVILAKGSVVEQGPVDITMHAPKTEFVRRLVASSRAVQKEATQHVDGVIPEPLVELRDVGKSYTRRGERFDAMRGIDLTVFRGRTLGVIGESGSGKTTTAMVLLGQVAPDSGKVILHTPDVGRSLSSEAPRRQVSVVFQNPFDALNPRMTVGASVLEPLEILAKSMSAAERTVAARQALALAQLDADEYWNRYPRSLSGGQQQRVTVARAIVTRPDVVVLDEPTASLDASVRAALLDTLEAVQREVGTAYFLISHDIATISRLADDVIVINNGQIVERGTCAEVLEAPTDEYTKTLLSAALQIQSEGSPSVHDAR